LWISATYNGPARRQFQFKEIHPMRDPDR
jgi:hypothetical protein